MDDFWDYVSKIPGKAVSTLKDTYNNNKDKIHDFIGSALTSAFP